MSVLCPGVVASDLYITSAKQRPERYGGPGEVELPAMGAGQQGMPPEDVGPTNITKAVASATSPSVAFVRLRLIARFACKATPSG